jgi:hypothetical protein
MAPRANRRTMSSVTAWIALGLVTLGLGAFGLVGCSKRVTSVDASFQVEGVPSTSQLFVFPDTPTIGDLYRDTLESGPSAGDYIIDHPVFFTVGAGTNRGMIFDYTQAGDFQIFRQESNGGYLSLKDFPIRDTKQWVDSHSELFQFTTRAPIWPGRSLSRSRHHQWRRHQHPPLTNGLADRRRDRLDDYLGDPPDDSLFTME